MKSTKTLVALSSLILGATLISGCASEEIDNSVLLDDSLVHEAPQEAVVTTGKQTPPSQKPVMPWEGKKIQYENNMGLTIADNVIYNDAGEEIGQIKGDNFFIDLQGHTYSFEKIGDVKQFVFNIGPVNRVLSDGLTINFPDTSLREKLTYTCNGPLISGQSSVGCATDTKSLLKQYEFGRDYRQFSTGADVGLNWKKIIIKKIGDKDVVFEGKFEGATISSYESSHEDFIPMESFLVYKNLRAYDLTPDLGINMKLDYANINEPAYKKDYETMAKKLEPIDAKMREVVKSKEYLEKLKSDPTNQAFEKKWDRIIESFEVVK